MAGPTQTKVYRGTSQEQHEAYMVDVVEASKFGWEPGSLEWLHGSMVVTYQQDEAGPPPRDIVRAWPGPARDRPELPRGPAPDPVPVKDRSGRWSGLAVLGSFVAAVVFAAWAMFLYSPTPPQHDGMVAAHEATVARCSPAPVPLMDAIEAGLTVTGGGGLRDGFTIVSAVHPAILFVAARISGIGMNGAVGLWATDDTSGRGAIYSVNITARSVSVWPVRDQSQDHVSELDDGADVVMACADG